MIRPYLPFIVMFNNTYIRNKIELFTYVNVCDNKNEWHLLPTREIFKQNSHAAFSLTSDKKLSQCINGGRSGDAWQ